jgi:hypothetical protein
VGLQEKKKKKKKKKKKNREKCGYTLEIKGEIHEEEGSSST